MAVSDNTRSNENRRWEELYQQMQRSMEEFKEEQGRVNDQIRELITGLSRQVLQIANNAVTMGEISSGNSNHPLSRLSRIDFLRFDGEDVQGWVYRCEQFFEVHNTAENLKVKIASIHLSSKALLWHQSVMKHRSESGWPRWEEYKMAITTRFGAKLFDDPLAELMKLKQSGTVEQYQ